MKATKGMRPNFHSVGGYDGMHLIYEAVRKTGGNVDGERLVDAMKGTSWTSPRGPMSIDPATRDVVQTVYIRKVELRDGHYWSIEFDKIDAVKDPGT
jgi:branched-chain amino acid transport system substrate-binding protein